MDISFKGIPIHTSGNMPVAGARAPFFTLVKNDLTDATLGDFYGSRIVLNIFPSLDSPVSAASVRKFNQLAAGARDTVVLCVSKDLPFAQARFCAANGIKNAITLSDIRFHSDFGRNYGLVMEDGPLSGLLARTVIAINERGVVIYAKICGEITSEPDYGSIVKAMRRYANCKSN